MWCCEANEGTSIISACSNEQVAVILQLVQPCALMSHMNDLTDEVLSCQVTALDTIASGHSSQCQEWGAADGCMACFLMVNMLSMLVAWLKAMRDHAVSMSVSVAAWHRVS